MRGWKSGLYRDLALGCAYDGGEVWAAPHVFATAVSLGAPPDRFNAQGQVWNLPPYQPARAGAPRNIVRTGTFSAPTCAMPGRCASITSWARRGSSGCRAVLPPPTAPT